MARRQTKYRYNLRRDVRRSIDITYLATSDKLSIWFLARRLTNCRYNLPRDVRCKTEITDRDTRFKVSWKFTVISPESDYFNLCTEKPEKKIEFKVSRKFRLYLLSVFTSHTIICCKKVFGISPGVMLVVQLSHFCAWSILKRTCYWVEASWIRSTYIIIY
jgi:hypothetical protein